MGEHSQRPRRPRDLQVERPAGHAKALGRPGGPGEYRPEGTASGCQQHHISPSVAEDDFDNAFGSVPSRYGRYGWVRGIVKPRPLGYTRPESVAAALAALAAPDVEAKVLAGGQSLVPLMSLRLAAPDLVVDINRLTELSYVRVADGQVRVGALARHADVLANPAAAAAQPLLGKALRFVAHPAIRNRGTTVGSIVHADPAGEMPAVLALLGGTVSAASATGTRSIPAGEFFLGPLESALQPGELATEVQFPALPRPAAGTGFAEISRRRGDYAVCGVAAMAWLRADGRIGGAKAAYLSMASSPAVIDFTEAVAGGVADAISFPAAASLARSRLRPDSDIHASASYRRQLAGVLTERALVDALAEARETIDA
jgi:carbon-monoxide dehydrogenase medium subunit